jgi:hypothetical protein
MKLQVNAQLRIKHIDLYLKTTLSTVVHVFTLLQVLVQYAMEVASSTAHISDDVLVYSIRLCTCVFYLITLEWNDCNML